MLRYLDLLDTYNTRSSSAPQPQLSWTFNSQVPRVPPHFHPSPDSWSGRALLLARIRIVDMRERWLVVAKPGDATRPSQQRRDHRIVDHLAIPDGGNRTHITPSSTRDNGSFTTSQGVTDGNIAPQAQNIAVADVAHTAVHQPQISMLLRGVACTSWGVASMNSLLQRGVVCSSVVAVIRHGDTRLQGTPGSNGRPSEYFHS